MFMSDKTTVNECLSKNLFGLPGHMMSRMDTISDSSLLFLYNKDLREVFGIFRASGRPGMNLDSTAYAPLSFPAQVRTAASFIDMRAWHASFPSWLPSSARPPRS
jgi:hypothetical protein